LDCGKAVANTFVWRSQYRPTNIEVRPIANVAADQRMANARTTEFQPVIPHAATSENTKNRRE
jgi:hypothetical protein